ncbi:CHAT domain-containing protein [Novipirellula sp. SH528]|uniref:CHAT domain-containing protein n=1 Tax=Novipirellula sp. SH528 TaxID=3454466 RepID=UPI003F9F29DF
MGRFGRVDRVLKCQRCQFAALRVGVLLIVTHATAAIAQTPPPPAAPPPATTPADATGGGYQGPRYFVPPGNANSTPYHSPATKWPQHQPSYSPGSKWPQYGPNYYPANKWPSAPGEQRFHFDRYHPVVAPQNAAAPKHTQHSDVVGKHSDVEPHAGHAHKSTDDVPRMLRYEDAERLAKDNVASAQEQLAQLYIDYGHYDEAIAQLAEVMKHFADDPTAAERHAIAANRLARVHLELGEFGKSRQLLDQNVQRLNDAAAKPSNTKQPFGDVLGDTLALLAEFCRETGDFKQAETLHEKILKRRSEVFGEQHREYAVALHNFGIFRWRQERFEVAEELLRRELQLTEQLSPSGPELAHSRESLAVVLTSLGKFDEAESLFLAALKTFEGSAATERDRYRTLSNLGFLHIFDGRHTEALQLFSDAANGRKALLGEDHLDYADTLADAARLRLASGNDERAVEVSRKTLAITRKNIELTSAAQSERQQLAMASLFRERLDLLLTAAANYPDAAKDAFEEILAWKGSTLVRQRRMRKLSQQASIADQYKKLRQITMQIASLSRSSPAEINAMADWKTTLTAMMAEKETLEAELSRTNAEFRSAQSPPSLAQLAASLPQDSVLIDYFEYASLSPEPGKGRFQGTPSLLASVVKPDGSVLVIPLGSATEIANDIDQWRQSFGVSSSGRNAGKRLRERIWEPLLPAIGNAATLLVSTDRPLGRFPLAALPGRIDGTYLIEDHRIAMVPVPQLIPALVKREGRPALSKHLLVMGDVDYDDPNQSHIAVNDTASKLPWDRSSRGLARRGSEKFLPLEHTAGEIAAIQRLYKNQAWATPEGIVTLDRRNATEARFRELAPQCYQLHLATHGFFAAPSVVSSDSVLSSSGKRLAADDPLAVRGISPGLLSGLAFTGANATPMPDRDDGILTADEIAFLPLDGVELVVLSACETGLGEVAGGEGLIGIQRSFQVSGARTTVASLWKVPDLATRLLMEQFYKNYWGDQKMSRLDAMRTAQLWVLNHPDDLRGLVRDSGESDVHKTPPEYWAAFVLSGDWR